MGIKSKSGMSSVHVNSGSMIPGNPNNGVKIIGGKHIVNKPINTHRSNPGYKAGK
jgi:hypothetical protein